MDYRDWWAAFFTLNQSFHGKLAKYPWWVLGVDGQTWTVATDGILLAAWAARLYGARQCLPNHADMLGNTLAPFASQEELSGPVAPLRHWCGSVEWPRLCSGCQGEGEVACPTCGCEHECHDCEGAGVWRSQQRKGRLLGLAIDRSRLAQLLALVDTHEVRLRRWRREHQKPGDTVLYQDSLVLEPVGASPFMRLILMPLVDQGHELPTFPVAQEAP